jgi:predicted nucleic acid-binding Zn finger protein
VVYHRNAIPFQFPILLESESCVYGCIGAVDPMMKEGRHQRQFCHVGESSKFVTALFFCACLEFAFLGARRAKLVTAWFKRKIGLGAGKMVKY